MWCSYHFWQYQFGMWRNWYALRCLPLCDLDIIDAKLFDNVALYMFCLSVLCWVGSCSFGKSCVGLGRYDNGLGGAVPANWTHVHLWLGLDKFCMKRCQEIQSCVCSTIGSEMAILSAKFEVYTTIHCWVIAFLWMIRYVTLWPWPLTFWP